MQFSVRVLGVPGNRAMRKGGEAMTTRVDDIRAALYEDGYEDLVGREREIQTALRAGALLWTAARLTTTDASRIDARPGRGLR